MIHSKILISCVVPFLIVACETQEPPIPADDTIKLKTAPEKTTIKYSKSVLKLSIDNLPVEPHNSEQNNFTISKPITEKKSTLFKTLSKQNAESDINLSGKVLTDSDKLDNKEYLDSVEGVQINIEGNFE